MIQKRFIVRGMHCASCAFVIRDTLKKIAGISKIDVNYASETAHITYDPDAITIEKINKTIQTYGYFLEARVDNANSHHSNLRSEAIMRLRRRVQIVFPVSLTVFIIMMWNSATELFHLPILPIPMMIFNMLYLAITTALFATVGKKYIYALARFAQYRVANMDTLVGLGTVTAFTYSLLLTLFPALREILHAPETMYFDTAIVIIGFILLGDYLVARSRLKTGEALQKLMGLQAKSATILREGKEIEILVDQLREGDIFLVKPGQKIATDGVIIEGNSSIDESVITGESMPVDKTVRDTVVGATLNKQGSLKVRVTKTGDKAMLAQIIQMVQKAQDSRAPIQDLVDKVTGVFVPVVLLVAILTCIIWTFVGRFDMGLTSFIAILVVACPCAMGLATPIAIIVGVGRAAQSGILIKDAQSLQRLSTVTHVVFDKTGTITKGSPAVTDVITLQPDAFQLLASLENHSEHPIAQAILQQAHRDTIPLLSVDNFSALPGQGLKGDINGTTFYVGSDRMLRHMQIAIDEKIINKYTKEGKTPIIISTSDTIIGYVAVADIVREDSHEAVERLHSLGLKVVMLTGDHTNVADHIARLTGIDTVKAQLLPQDKARTVVELQSDGHIVAMVGDGINDAPALASAHIGIAMGTGTDIAIESAGITLLGGSITKVHESIILARATMRTIRQNLFWAFFYNSVGIPLAGGVLYPVFRIALTPAMEGAAMAFSSFSVVANSLRLKYIKI